MVAAVNSKRTGKASGGDTLAAILRENNWLSDCWRNRVEDSRRIADDPFWCGGRNRQERAHFCLHPEAYPLESRFGGGDGFTASTSASASASALPETGGPDLAGAVALPMLVLLAAGGVFAVRLVRG